MGKLIGLLVAAGIGFGIYWMGFHKSPAYLAYLQWTTATNNGDCKTLYDISDGDAKKWVDGFCGASGGMTIMGKVIPSTSAAAMVAELKNTPQGAMQQIHHDLESEDEAADGTVSLVVTETVLGRHTNFSHPPPPSRHEVKIKEIGGVWKIMDFKSTELEEKKN